MATIYYRIKNSVVARKLERAGTIYKYIYVQGLMQDVAKYSSAAIVSNSLLRSSYTHSAVQLGQHWLRLRTFERTIIDTIQRQSWGRRPARVASSSSGVLNDYRYLDSRPHYGFGNEYTIAAKSGRALALSSLPAAPALDSAPIEKVEVDQKHQKAFFLNGAQLIRKIMKENGDVYVNSPNICHPILVASLGNHHH